MSQSTTSRRASHRLAALFISAVIVGVALLDIGTGLFLGLADDPTGAHGEGTIWLELGPLLEGTSPRAEAVRSLFRRMGAFQFFAGGATLVWWVYGRRRAPSALTVLLTTYLVLGVAFFLVDRRYFAGTSYLLYKQVVGAAWTAAWVLQVWLQRARSETPRV